MDQSFSPKTGWSSISAEMMGIGLKRVLLIGYWTGFVISCETATTDAPDLVLHNGKIVTLDRAFQIAEALAIKDDKIVAVGGNDSITALAGSETRLIDLEDRTVAPGFADNHYHNIGGGPGVDLSSTRSLGDVLEAIAERARETPEGEVISTNGDWHEGQLREQRLPYRDELDEAAPHHPAVVVRGGHEYILNSAALAKWAIDETTKVPDGGSIGRYDDGRLNGELVDRAKRFVKLLPQASVGVSYRLDGLVSEHRRLNEVGLTSIRYASGNKELYDALAELKRRGDLTLRVNVLFRLQALDRSGSFGRRHSCLGRRSRRR